MAHVQRLEQARAQQLFPARARSAGGCGDVDPGHWILDDGRVVMLGGADRSERLLPGELHPDGDSRELPLPVVEGSLAGLVSLEGRRGFALVSADDEAVHLTVLGVR